MKRPPDKHSTHKTIKTSLKNVVKKDETIEKIGKVVIMANKIVTHTLQFMKLYFLHCYDNNIKIPYIDREYVKCFMKVICKAPSQGRKPTEETLRIKEELSSFYKQHYEDLKSEELAYTHMNTILDYLADTIVTIYENNIKQHYTDYLTRYVEIVWKKKDLVQLINSSKKSTEQKRQHISKLCSNIKKIKNDIICNTKSSNQCYHTWIESTRKNVLPQKEFQNDSVYYDVVCSSQDYLPCMVFMMRQIEKHDVFLNSVFPLRREIIPKYIPIDTTTLCHILLTEKKGYYLTKGNLKIHQQALWEMFFKTSKKCFYANDRFEYQFSHMIETDGIGCSILLIRKDLKGKRLVGQRATSNNEVYIDELSDYSTLKNKKIVAIDPNMSDLIYCVNGTEKEATSFRYTQDQRRKETKQKKYRDMILEKKTRQVNGKTIIEWETSLSSFNSKTLDFDKFKEYIKHKNIVNQNIVPFYEERIFRKLKLGSFMMRQKTESRMLNRFEKLFGKPDDVIVGFGDFEQHQHRKFKEPIKGKSFRNLFRRAGYEVFLVNEFRTSCRCSACEGECKTFRKCVNPRPWKNIIILRHGLVHCEKCNRLWNRDMNAANNIFKVMETAISGRDRPSYLQRSLRPHSDTTSVSPPTI